jgi:hypothetical protein
MPQSISVLEYFIVIHHFICIKTSVARVREQTIPMSDRRMLAKLVPTFVDRGCHVVRVIFTKLSKPIAECPVLWICHSGLNSL